MSKSKSNQHGDLKGEATESRQGTQSSGGDLGKMGSRPISVMLDTTAHPNQNSQVTKKSSNDETPNTSYINLIQALSAKLGVLVEWRKVSFKDGKSGYALFFDAKKWNIDPETGSLVPR